jgi:hypothetical protein
MKTNNKTEINFDQLEKVTGGITDVAWPVKSGLTQNGSLAIGTDYPPKTLWPVGYPYMSDLVQTDSIGTGPIDPAILPPPKKAVQSIRV